VCDCHRMGWYVCLSLSLSLYFVHMHSRRICLLSVLGVPHIAHTLHCKLIASHITPLPLFDCATCSNVCYTLDLCTNRLVSLWLRCVKHVYHNICSILCVTNLALWTDGLNVCMCVRYSVPCSWKTKSNFFKFEKTIIGMRSKLVPYYPHCPHCLLIFSVSR
jgi:hypothetical protein